MNNIKIYKSLVHSNSIFLIITCAKVTSTKMERNHKVARQSWFCGDEFVVRCRKGSSPDYHSAGSKTWICGPNFPSSLSEGMKMNISR